VRFPNEQLEFSGNMESVAPITSGIAGGGGGRMGRWAGYEWRDPRGHKLGEKMNLFKFKKSISYAQKCSAI
jgi:hypothetical protein